MWFFAVGVKWVIYPVWVFGLTVGNLLRAIVVAVAKLIELEVGILAVGVALNTLQSAKEQGLTHHTQVLAQWVHNLYASI